MLPSQSESASFALLDERIQRWIWGQQWTELRDIQETAIRPILEESTDIIVSSPTASGKTEAAFLPILTHILARGITQGLGALYIGPLKALINDQFERLDGLCEALGIPVWRWHGDISQSKKRSLLERPQGILLITPESLESVMINHSSQISRLFGRLSFVVIDELHSFIGTERGSQLQSLLDRLERALERQVPRIALSATLSNMALAQDYLRHDKKLPCVQVEGGRGQQELKAQIRGYEKSAPEHIPGRGPESDVVRGDDVAIASDLFKMLRGQTNLVFANRRADVERYADLLRSLSEEHSIPNEFWPHHGSLSKNLREDVERIMKDKSRPSTAIATTTLELGVDIGMVNSVAQIGPPFSVAGLRQRLGRSGRRGQPAILRMFVQEEEITNASHPLDKLRCELVQAVAMLELLLQGWYEPPIDDKLHLSTLVHQTLALIAQYGGVRASTAWDILCRTGPFGRVTKDMYVKILKGLGGQDLISQNAEGLLLLGLKGERIVNHYSFYSVFNTPEEFTLVAQDGTVLGTIPIDFPVTLGYFLIFGGKRWEVVHIDLERRVIGLTPSRGGRPPEFGGSSSSIHDRVRQEMLRLYQSIGVPPYLNAKAAILLEEGRDSFRKMELDHRRIVQDGNDVMVFPWRGDSVINTLVLQALSDGLRASPEGISIRFTKKTTKEISAYLHSLPVRPLRSAAELASFVKNKIVEKFDPYLTEELLNVGYASGYITIAETAAAIGEMLMFTELPKNPK